MKLHNGEKMKTLQRRKTVIHDMPSSRRPDDTLTRPPKTTTATLRDAYPK